MARQAATVLEAKNLRLGYDGRVVLRDVSLRLQDGEALALLGPNGAGKTTLLRTLAGIHSADAGSVTLDGAPIHALPRREVARRVAYVPQELSLLFPFRVIEVVLMGRYPHHRFSAFETSDDLEAARESLERTDLWDLRDRRFHELSGGERRRALLAQAICQRPAVVLLDEPTASLDVAHELAFFDALKAERAERGLAVVVATHNLGIAARYVEDAVLLHGTECAERGATLDVLRSLEAAKAFGVALHVGVVPETQHPYCVPR